MSTITITSSDQQPMAFWRSPQYLALLSGTTAMFFGYAGTILLRSLLTWQLTGDEMALALLNLAAAVSLVGGALFSGAAVDRFERRKLMVGAHLLLLAVESGGLYLYVTEQLRYHHLVTITMVMCIAFSFINPGRTALLVDAVGTRQLSRAMATMAGGTNLARMASPAIAGVLAEHAGITIAYSLLIVLYGGSLVAALCLQPSQPKPTQGHLLSDIKAGFHYLFTNRPLAACLLFGLLPNIVIAPLQAVLVVFSDEVWQRGGAGLGILLAMMGSGGLLGSGLLMLIKLKGLTRPMLAGGVSLAATLLAFSLAPSFGAGALLLLLSSACAVYTQTLVQSAAQMLCTHAMRGRVATFNLILIGIAPAFTVPLAWAISAIGPRGAVFCLGLATGIASLLVYRYSSSFRSIDEATTTLQRNASE